MHSSSSLRLLRGHLLREAITLLLFTSLLLQCVQAAAPGWWSTQGVINPQKQADDYAVANIGQLKAIAANAAKEMNAQVQQGAGNDINTLVASWSNPQPPKPRDDYAALTQGQLKAVAKLFYDQLAVIGGLSQPAYPWGHGGVADDYALVNIGQLKAVFSFLVPYKVWRLGDPNNPSPNDLNGNGISDQYEASRGWNDTNNGTSGLSQMSEAWNNASGDVDNGNVIAGVYMKTTKKYGSAISWGIPPLMLDPNDTSNAAGFDFYTKMNFDNTASAVTTDGGTKDDYTGSLNAEVDLTNAIQTSNNDPTTGAFVSDLSLSASINETVTVTASSTSQTVSTYIGSGSLTSKLDYIPYDFLYHHPFQNGTYTVTHNGTIVSTDHTLDYGNPTANSIVNPTITRTADTEIFSVTNDEGTLNGTKYDYNYSLSETLSGKESLSDLISAAKSDLGKSEAKDSEVKIADVGDVVAAPTDTYAFTAATKGTQDHYNPQVEGTQYDYSFEYRVPGGITNGLPSVSLNWFEVTRKISDLSSSNSTQTSLALKSATLLPGETSDKYHLKPMEGFSQGKTEMYVAHTSYVDSAGNYINRITPTTLPPTVSLIFDPHSDVVIDHAGQTATITLSGTAYDQLAAALPTGSGADIQTVDVYVNGGLAAESVQLQLEGDSPGYYYFDSLTVTTPLAESIVVEVKTSANLIGKTFSTGITLNLEPVMGAAPQAQPRSIDVLLHLPSAFNPLAKDTITLLPPSGVGAGVAALETDIDSRVFVTADGYIISVPDGYTGTSTEQTIQCYIPSTGGSGSGVLVPDSGSVTCTEIGTDTNIFAYHEQEDGFELPAPVVDWDYNEEVNYFSSDAIGDFAPFSYFVGGSWNPGDLQITPFQGGPNLKAPFGSPQFEDGGFFQAFVIPNADGTGYDLLYADQDAGTFTRTPYTGALTAQVQLADGNSDGASIDLWTLEWQDVNGQPSDGPGRMTADALVSYVARADHDGIEIPDEFCARLKVTGLPTGYGVTVESSEEVDSFTLVPPDQMPSGSAIASRLATLQSIGDGSYISSQYKIIIYQPTDNVSSITDQEWQALKNAGYLAVHNFDAKAWINSFFDGSKKTKIFSAVPTEHHIFQFFDKSPDKALAARAKAFWKSLGIDPDQFTCAWNQSLHVSAHQNGITKDWLDFINKYGGATGVVPSNIAQQVKSEAVLKAFTQVKTYGIPIHNMKVYLNDNSKPGSSLKGFMDMHAVALGGIKTPEEKLAFIKEYKDSISKARKVAGRISMGAFARNLGPLGWADLLIGSALLFHDPAQALAEKTGLPRETWVELFEAWSTGDNPDQEAPPINGVNAQMLPNGDIISIGMPWRIYEVKSVTQLGPDGQSTMTVPQVLHVIDATIYYIRPGYRSGKGNVADIQVEYRHPYTFLI